MPATVSHSTRLTEYQPWGTRGGGWGGEGEGGGRWGVLRSNLHSPRGTGVKSKLGPGLDTAGRGRWPLQGFSWEGSFTAVRAFFGHHVTGHGEDVTPYGGLAFPNAALVQSLESPIPESCPAARQAQHS